MRAATLLIAVAACYSPDPPDGVACGANDVCPEPLMCSFGTCVAEAPPCVEIDDGMGQLRIPLVTSDLKVDGDLSDWPTCFITVNEQTAGLVRDLGADGMFTPGRFSIATDGEHVFVGAEVTQVLPLGDEPVPDVFKNNAISVYFDGDGQVAGAAYDEDAAQIVVDHANRTQGFHTGGLLVIDDLETAATVGETTFTIEMSVDANSFGLKAFGDHIGFDIGLVGGNGGEMTSELVWFQACAAPECGCSSGSDSAPYCDAREMGVASFEP